MPIDIKPSESFTVLKSQFITLGTSGQAYLIPDYPIPNRKKLIIYNAGSIQIYIGGSDLTSSNGLIVGMGDYFIINAPNNVYALSQATNHTLRILEVS